MYCGVLSACLDLQAGKDRVGHILLLYQPNGGTEDGEQSCKIKGSGKAKMKWCWGKPGRF
jgi:hypothetical protein